MTLQAVTSKVVAKNVNIGTIVVIGYGPSTVGGTVKPPWGVEAGAEHRRA